MVKFVPSVDLIWNDAIAYLLIIMLDFLDVGDERDGRVDFFGDIAGSLNFCGDIGGLEEVSWTVFGGGLFGSN